MEKNNGSNSVPGWVKRDLQMLKRVSVSLVEMQRETHRRMSENETRIAQNEEILSEMRQQHAMDFTELRQQTAAIKKTSDIHTKAILKLLKKI